MISMDTFITKTYIQRNVKNDFYGHIHYKKHAYNEMLKMISMDTFITKNMHTMKC